MGKKSRKAGPREPNGRLQRQTRAEREAAVRAQVEARSRALGIWPSPPVRAWGETLEAFEGRKRAHDQMVRACGPTAMLPWMGCTAGRAVAGEVDVVDLWQVIQTVRQRRAAFLVAIGARSEHAETLNLGVAPGEGDPDEEVRRDLRPEDERHESAMAAWDDVERPLSWPERRVLQDVVIHGQPAVHGIAAVLRKVGVALEIIEPDAQAVSVGYASRSPRRLKLLTKARA